MDNVNSTLYIPLYGKAKVSQMGIILEDRTAEKIWAENTVLLGKKSKSKWLAYFMAMRARVFDDWVRKMLAMDSEVLVLHIGCGLDSRVHRVGASGVPWYDLDFPEVIARRRKYYSEDVDYHMVAGDAAQPVWLEGIPRNRTAVIIMEGIAMYLPPDTMERMMAMLSQYFSSAHLMMDVYTNLGAKLSKWKNPVTEVGVTTVYGLNHPTEPLGKSRIRYVREHSMTPPELVNQLAGMERILFRLLFAGGAAKKMYRMYEYEWQQ